MIRPALPNINFPHNKTKLTGSEVQRYHHRNGGLPYPFWYQWKINKRRCILGNIFPLNKTYQLSHVTPPYRKTTLIARNIRHTGTQFCKWRTAKKIYSNLQLFMRKVYIYVTTHDANDPAVGRCRFWIFMEPIITFFDNLEPIITYILQVFITVSFNF